MSKLLSLYHRGMIGLLALPVVFMWLLAGFLQPKLPKVNKMVVWNEDKRWPGDGKTTREHLKEKIAGKRITEVHFVQDRGYYDRRFKQAKLDFVFREIERITFAHDTSTVIKMMMGDLFTYGDFNSLLNNIQFYGVKRYCIVDDCFYIFANEPPAYEQ